MTPVFNGFHRYAVGAEFEKNEKHKRLTVRYGLLGTLNGLFTSKWANDFSSNAM